MAEMKKNGRDDGAPKWRQWPTMDAKAYRGLAGIIAETIGPHSEADPVALLIQVLVCAGNVIGRRFYYPVESVPFGFCRY